MSRALNLNADQADVIATCAKKNAEISAIESLLSGGTRVVLMNIEDAVRIKRAYGTKVMTGPVNRAAWVRNA